MHPTWQSFLRNHGAVIVDDRVAHFGEPDAELLAVQNSTVLCDLSHSGLIAFSGEDAQAFLHGQLTCDMKKATAHSSQYGGYCTPKGRLLATFLMWQNDAVYFLQLPGALREAVQKRLSLFILRSKVQAVDASNDKVRLGLAGAQAQALIERVLDQAPAAVHAVLHHSRASVIRLPGERFEIVATLDQAPALWQALGSEAKAVGAVCWEWLEIRAGIPGITPATQEQFVPQMVNLEAIGGVSFHKGCYPGQEIVARTQYLGKLKRRMYLAHLDPPSLPQPGDELFSADMAEQACGMVVNAAPAPGGGYDLLAVIQVGSVDSQSVHWQSPDGMALKWLALPPYPG